MKKKFILTSLVIMLITAAFVPIVTSADAYSWYCQRNSNHQQPSLPSEFSVIDKYSVLWLNDRRQNNEEKKIAYLTFDAGYENGNISKILDILKEKEVKGAFFILENLINSNPELVLRMQKEGHLVCNHTTNHKDMSKVIEKEDFFKELNQLEIAYKNLTGCEISKYYRPPEGKFNEKNLEHADEFGYTTVFWSFAYADWDNGKQPSTDYAIKKILDNTHNGEVLLLHPTSQTNAKILGTIIDEMRNNGYEFGTLDDLAKEIQQN